MVTYRVMRWPQGRPQDGVPLGEAFTAETAVAAGEVAMQRIGPPEAGCAYWLEYMDAAGQWRSAGAVVGGPW